MSPEATRTLITRYLDAFNAKDFEGMLDCLDEDVAHDINQGGREIGRDAFRWFNAQMAKHYDERLTDIVIMVNETGSRAAAEFTVHGRYEVTAEGLPEADGQGYSLPAAILFEIDAGRITRVSTHYNLKDWIAQVSR